MITLKYIYTDPSGCAFSDSYDFDNVESAVDSFYDRKDVLKSKYSSGGIKSAIITLVVDNCCLIEYSIGMGV